VLIMAVNKCRSIKRRELVRLRQVNRIMAWLVFRKLKLHSEYIVTLERNNPRYNVECFL